MRPATRTEILFLRSEEVPAVRYTLFARTSHSGGTSVGAQTAECTSPPPAARTELPCVEMPATQSGGRAPLPNIVLLLVPRIPHC